MEIGITGLWLAILLSALIVWVASALVWMVLPHHKKDFKRLPDEAAAIDALRPQNLAPGQYNIPHCQSWDEAKKPEMMEKFNKGPVGYLRILPNGMPNMGKNMALAFVHYLVVGVVLAYILSRTLPPGAEYLTVFRLAGLVTWVAYGMGSVNSAIWFGLPRSSAIKQQVDSLL
ncbi:MAG: hypothetical protein IH914_08710 [candidate division Zixibacteria bacterium]|nr:hypothetical protein [candidate division Zixibacteria bacterium]